jgi:hypothetical protein
VPGKSSNFSIKVKNASGAIRLSWDILPENNTRYWLVRSNQQKTELKSKGSIDVGTTGNITIQATAQPPPCEY